MLPPTRATLPFCALWLSSAAGSARGYPALADTLPDTPPAYYATAFPEGILGKWLPSGTQAPQSVLGPLAYEFVSAGDGAFTAQRDPTTGDVWLTILEGQTFRVRDGKMQYCFGLSAANTTAGTPAHVSEQSPFSVANMTKSSVQFCWRSGLPGMQTHTKGCRGCDCASIRVALHPDDPDSAELTFHQSPPVVHAHLVLKRAGPAPEMKQITQTLPQPYSLCQITDTCMPYQFCPLAASSANASAALPPPSPRRRRRPAGCLLAAQRQAARARARLLLTTASAMEAEAEAEAAASPVSAAAAAEPSCFHLNGMNLQINGLLPAKLRYDLPDVKLQITKPEGSCSPCDVSYAVSAALTGDQYIAVGFKGESWEGEDYSADTAHPHPATLRPCYFGMCVDEYDNYTTDRIVVGYSGAKQGACVREMVSRQLAGEPVDVPKSERMLRATSVEQRAGRTVMRFTLSQHWPEALPSDGYFRVMWAQGAVSGSGRGCAADLGFHGINRGVAPLEWLNHNSRPCVFDTATE